MKEIFDTLAAAGTSTGIGISLYTRQGRPLFSTAGRLTAQKLPSALSPAEVKADGDENKTFFAFTKGGETFIGAIDGADAACVNYARLVLSLVEKTVKGNAVLITREERFKMLLRGELDPVQAESLRSGYQGKPFSFYVLTLIVKPQSKLPEVAAFLRTMSERADIITPVDDKTVVFIKECGGPDEYASANDFAHILLENLKEEIRAEIKINVGGTARGFNDILEAYRQSLFAYNFGMLLDPAAAVYSYKEYVAAKMFSDIPKESLSRYFDTLFDNGSLELLRDDELMNTADAFMKNSLNISETSRNMYMHRNTLIYRLDKIENATGLNIRRFNDAVTFRLITMLSKLIKK
ncbi:MAG: helix-turn-helix domain-containing protein [Clostridiales bacterium]|jgi:carbohydrate diacid regulator|nr:helix-turn-helix domain-containing protein [Clostridiales bacterium]